MGGAGGHLGPGSLPAGGPDHRDSSRGVGGGGRGALLGGDGFLVRPHLRRVPSPPVLLHSDVGSDEGREGVETDGGVTRCREEPPAVGTVLTRETRVSVMPYRS